MTALADLDRWIARARETGIVSVDTETTSLDAMQAGLCGISLAVAPGEACYIPTGHCASEGLNLGDNRLPEQLAEALVLERLKPLLEDTSVLKIAQNMKYDYLLFLQRGIRIAAFDDTMLIHYVLDGGLRAHGMDELSVEHLNHTPISFQDVAGKGRDKKTFDYVPVREATRYAAEDADIAFRLHALLKPRLIKQGKVTVYETLERPLVPVLCDMEREGIMIDPCIDFSKNTYQSLEILRNVDKLVATGWPVLMALSNKDFVGETLGVGEVTERLEGTLAATAVAAAAGARVFRAHEVSATRRTLEMVASIVGTRAPARTVRALA